MDKTRLLSNSHVEMHEKVLQLGEDSYLKSNWAVTKQAAEEMSLVFDYPELVTFVGVQRDYLLEHNPDMVPEFDNKWG
jgi:hypothetical protein